MCESSLTFDSWMNREGVMGRWNEAGLICEKFTCYVVASPYYYGETRYVTAVESGGRKKGGLMCVNELYSNWDYAHVHGCWVNAYFTSNKCSSGTFDCFHNSLLVMFERKRGLIIWM